MGSEASRDETHVLFVDSHPAIREVLTSAIESTADLKVAGEAADADAALRLIEQTAPDVVVLEISLGKSDGLAFIQEIRSHGVETRVLVFSRYDEDLYAERAIQAGASGYVMKTEPTDEVMRAIELVSQDQVYLSRTVSSRILSKLIQGEETVSISPLEKLTDRELTVFRKIGEGYSVRQIAEQLDLNRKTIETYRREAKEKLGHDTVEELLRHAVQWVSGQEDAVRDQESSA